MNEIYRRVDGRYRLYIYYIETASNKSYAYTFYNYYIYVNLWSLLSRTCRECMQALTNKTTDFVLLTNRRCRSRYPAAAAAKCIDL